MALTGMRSAELKAIWAHKHLVALQSRIRTWVNEEASHPTTKDDLETGEFVVTILADNPPAEIALIAGDFICSLRSALDHLAWSLASINGKAGRETMFPIRHDNSIEAQVAIAKATFGFPEEAITLIRHLQPYHHGDAYKLKHLWRLHTLWNIDKHWFVTLDSTVIGWDIPEHLPQAISSQQLDDRVEMRFPPSAKEQMHLYPPPTREVRFGSKAKGLLLTTQDFVEIDQYVREGVIPMFKSFFP
jgi:hypothetical protein